MSKLVITPEKKPASPSQIPGSSRFLQRQCACGGTPGVDGECAECRKKRLGLQRFATGPQDSQAIPPIVNDVLRSPGQPLDPRTRATMEPGFAHDFSRVRVHTDSRAAESARAVNALAYTVGKDVVFDTGRYAPETNAGKKLLAHELTHVVQQQGLNGSVQPATAMLGSAGDHAEVEAEAAAHRIVAGLSAPVVTPLSGMPVQRQEKEKPAAAPLTRAEEIELSRTSPGQVTGSLQPFRLSLHNFAINDAELKDLHKQALQELADLVELTKPEGLLIYVQGHADSSGTAKINDPLSLQRAQAVQNSLGSLPGTGIVAEGFGETTPLTGNASVDERSLNRRVDIYLLVPSAIIRPQPGVEPIGIVPPPTPTIQEDPPVPVPVRETVEPPVKIAPPGSTTIPSGGEQPPEEQKDFCDDHPILCGALGLGGALAGTGISIGSTLLPPLLYCLLNPSACLPGTRRPDDPQEEPIERRACPIWADIAGSTDTTAPGRLLDALLHYNRSRASNIAYSYIYFLERRFEMKIEFAGDVGGCDCGCGEYKQELRGYFESSDAQGNLQREEPPVISGGPLDENEYREDGAFFRSLDRKYPSMMLRYGDRDVPALNVGHDKFLPERQTGCTYLGSDNPRTEYFRKDQRARIHLEFRGAPVDGCHNRELIPGWPWVYWTVHGEYNPQSSSKKPPKSPSMLPPIIVPQITPASPMDDTVAVNGVEIGRQTMDFLEHWQSPDRDLYLPYVFQAIEIEKSRLMMVYGRDSGMPSEELLQSAEFDMLQNLAQQTACRNVFTVVDMTDLISVYCEK